MPTCKAGFKSCKFKGQRKQWVAHCVRCGRRSADADWMLGIKERSGGHHGLSWGLREAKKLFGEWGVCLRAERIVRVGRFTKSPFGPPPWPIEIYGEGANVDEALAAARESRRTEER